MRRIFGGSRYANVTSTLALMVALGGTGAYAVNTVGSSDIQPGAVRSSDIANGTVSSLDIHDNGILSRDILNRSLRAVDFRRGELAAGAITGRLPSGATLRGVYGIAARSTANSVQAPISYGLVLGADPASHYVPSGGPAPAECPGDVNNPRADPGHLCVYERVAVGTTGVLVDHPADAGSARFGAIVQGNTAGSVDAIVKGTWAVTAS
jgi:hypothetical protein